MFFFVQLFFSTVFSSWLGLIQKEQSIKEKEADEFLKKKILRKCWNFWFKVSCHLSPVEDNLLDNNFQTVEKEQPKKQAASDLYEVKVCTRMLTQWTEVMKMEKRRRYGLMMKAVVFHRRLAS